MKQVLLYILFFSSVLLCSSQVNHLEASAKKYYRNKKQEVLHFDYKEIRNVLGHNFEPWQTNELKVKGELWIDKTHFLLRDSLTIDENRKYTSKSDFINLDVYHLAYGNNKIKSLSPKDVSKKLMSTARYTPLIMLKYLIENGFDNVSTEAETTIYSAKTKDFLVDIYINHKTNLVEKISCISYHELYGDLTTKFIYNEYDDINQVFFPKKITIEKINGKIIDHVEIVNNQIISGLTKLLDKPKDFKVLENQNTPNPQSTITRHSDFIYFLELINTDSKVMLVEFEDYVLVAEAPLNSKNGEHIVAEVEKLFPTKPIKYFVFGHHHPHYLGGLRAFVHKNATILCTENNKNYVEFIANSSHTLQPDNLENEPSPLKTEIIKDHLILGTKKKMEIYFIGKESKHTIDYLIFYFPEEQLLFEGDLCWIPKNGNIPKANARQLGLYNSIKALNLNVKTIIQSWPTKNHDVKAVIPFSDLEKSVKLYYDRDNIKSH